MFYVVRFVSLALFAQVAVSTPISARTAYAVKESHYLPQKWTDLGPAPRGHILDLQIGLKQSQFDELERHLYEVSDPFHERYGQHLSADEVRELVKPSDETSDLLHEWLSDAGIEKESLSYSPAKDWVSISLPVEFIEFLLDTKYRLYEHEDGTRLVRTTSWSLPEYLHEHVEAIQPSTSFLRAAPLASNALELDPWISENYTPPTNATIQKVCNVTSVTPECFMNLYSTKGYTASATIGGQVAFNNFLGEIPIRPDTKKFLAKYRPEAVSAAEDFKFIVYAMGPRQPGPLTYNQSLEGISREANLDVQAIAGISYPIPITAYTTGGSPPFVPDLNTPTNSNEPYLVWINRVLASKNVPQVISTSYGDDEQTVPMSYAVKVCNQFAQLGAQGVSLLFASGDRGVGLNKTCYSNDGKNTSMFIPSFPAGCPYVTTVGATHEFEPEVVAYRPGLVRPDGSYREIYSSGGGFSNYFPSPSYQSSVVKNYIKNLNGLYDGLYNKGGRGYPDISAQGQYFAYFWNGTEGTISGTSASTPLMSGIIALVNDALLCAGKPVLGFLNPFIYAKGFKGFTDITSGSAVGCQVDGFPATEGWDPVTGFGTPIFPKLKNLVGA